MSTLEIPPVLTSPRDDAIQLHKAFKGMGCDTSSVINILAHRNSTQRALIQQEYTSMYSEDLNKRLSSELSGNMKRAMLLWILDPATRDATIVNEALNGEIVNSMAATEIICSRTQPQIEQFRSIYYSLFSSTISNDIDYLITGHDQKLLSKYLATLRYDGPEVDQGSVVKDTKALFKAGEKSLGTNESVFINIFSERSRAHLNAICFVYHDMYGTSLKKAIKSETSGSFRFALLTILECAQNPGKYFAKALHKAMEGMGTDDTTLIRIIVSRAEIDMQYIKAEYRKKYRKSLNDVVRSETSGNYRNFLLALLGSGQDLSDQQ